MNNENVGEMTLRDYFAAKAMAHLITAEADNGSNAPESYAKIPMAAYAMADAMLNQRDRQP